MAGRPKGKNTQVVRTARLLDELRASRMGLTYEELAAEFEVHPRTIKRAIESLEEIGHEFKKERTDAGGLRIKLIEVKLAPVSLSMRERYALLAVRQVFDTLKDTPLYEDVHSVYRKISQGLPSNNQLEQSNFENCFVFLPDGGVKPYAGMEELMDALLTGVLRRWKVRCEYTNSKGKLSTSWLEPYAMVLYRQGLYVVARKEGESRPKVFAVERFKRAAYNKTQSFKVPDDFRVADFFEGAFGIFAGGERTKVVIDFAREVAAAVRGREWHRTQKLTALANGGVRLEMQVSHLAQVLPWVLGWGLNASVVEPRSLAEEVSHIARGIAARALASG